MNIKNTRRATACACALTVAMACANVGAAVSAIAPGAFTASSLLVDYASTPIGTNAKGLNVSGLTFYYSGYYSQDPATIVEWSATHVDGRSIYVPANPGSTPLGTMAVTLPGLSNMFGFGFYMPALGAGTLQNALTISLFDDSVVANTLVGTLSFAAVTEGDPLDPWSRLGGFAGIASTLPFNRVNWTFDRSVTEIVVDNFRVSVVPEPSARLMLALGIPTILLVQRRRSAKLRGWRNAAV